MPPRALLFLLCVPVAVAQPAAFETLEVGVGGMGTFADAPFRNFWDPGPGAEAWVEMPFYLGQIRLGESVAWHEAVEAEPDTAVPDFVAVYTFAGWGVGVALPAGVRLALGLRAGILNMRFDTDAPVAVRSEAELAAGFDLRASMPLAAGWRLTASGTAVRVFTAERIDLRLVQVGVSRTFGTPEWLKEFLR